MLKVNAEYRAPDWAELFLNLLLRNTYAEGKKFVAYNNIKGVIRFRKKKKF